MVQKTALKASEKASKILKTYYGRVKEKDVEVKGKNDFVSFVDREAEKAIVSTIKKEFPEHGFLLEESDNEKKNSKYCWIVDPLDGTTNYLRNHGHFAISIAFKENDELKFGLIHDVLKNDIYTASKNKGAKLNKNKINVSKISLLRDALILFGTPFRSNDQVDNFSKLFATIQKNVSDHRRHGAAALDFAYVASGKAEGFYEIGLKPWDVAAGDLIVKEAGGFVGDFNGPNNDLFRSIFIAVNRNIQQNFLDLFKGYDF